MPTVSLRLNRPLRNARVIASSSVPAANATPTAIDAAQQLQADHQLILRIRERLFAEIARLRGQWQDDSDRRLQQTRELAAELAVTIAAEFLQREINRGEFPFEKLAQEMVERLGGEGPVEVHLHPDDLALLQNRLGAQPIIDDRADLQVIADGDLSRGDCRVECEAGIVVSDLAERLADVRANLAELGPCWELIFPK